MEVIRQFLAADTPASLMKLVGHEQSSIAQQSVSLLLKLSLHDDARPVVGNAGAIPYFIEKIKELEASSKSFRFLNVLCLCCQEAVNRVRVRENQGLNLMVKLLDCGQYAVMHDRLISAFVCFLYDDPSIELLLELGIVNLLLQHLKRCAVLGSESETNLGQGGAIGEQKDKVIVLPSPKVSDENSVDAAVNHKFNKTDEKNEHQNKETLQYPNKAPKMDCGNKQIQVENEASNTGVIYAEEMTSKSVKCNSSAESAQETSVLKEKMEVSKHNHLKYQLITCNSDDNKVDVQAVCVSKHLTLANANPDIKVPDLGGITLPSIGHSNLPPVDSAMEISDVPSVSTAVGKSDEQVLDPGVEKSLAAVGENACDGNSSITADSAGCNTVSGRSVYSIHSPTYQAACDEWNFEDYFKGSKCKESFSPPSLSSRSSPMCISPVTAYSPMSTTSYGSPDWSPDYNRFSPVDFPGDLDAGYGLMSNVPSPGEWGSDSSGGFSPPCSGATWWCPQELPKDEHHYSSEEELDALNLDTTDEPDLLHPSTGHSRLAFSLTEENPAIDELPFISISIDQDHSISECSSDTKGSNETSNRTKSFKMTALSDICPRRDSSDKRNEKQKLVTVRKKDISKTKDPLKEMLKNSIDDMKEHSRASIEPGAVTSSNILLLLSRFSHATEPCHNLVSYHCFHLLLSYLVQVNPRSHRCFRLLCRLTRNPNCLERLLVEMIPSLIYDLLVSQSSKIKRPKCKRELQSSSSQPRKIKSMKRKLYSEDIPSCDRTKKSKQPLDKDIRNETFKNDVVISQSLTVAPETDEEMEGECTLTSGDMKTEAMVEQGESLLKNLHLLAESRFGSGVISHILLSASEEQRIKCIVGLPFVCRSGEMRQKIFDNRKCLQILLHDISVRASMAIQNQHEVQYTQYYHAVHALHYLSKTLRIQHTTDSAQNPHKLLRENPCEIELPLAKRQKLSNKDTVSDTAGHVTFITSDGCQVRVNRDMLCRTSHVFAAMLQGHFSESNKTDISIPGVNGEAFMITMDFLQKGVYEGDLSLDTCLDILFITDQYMLHTVQSIVSKYILTVHVDVATVARVFQHAVTHNCSQLRVDVVKWILVSEMTVERRGLCLQALARCPVRKQGVESIFELILERISK